MYTLPCCPDADDADGDDAVLLGMVCTAGAVCDTLQGADQLAGQNYKTYMGESQAQVHPACPACQQGQFRKTEM
jgi:hypothetical protein